MDNTLRVWDVRPFVTTDRCVKIITGHKHNFEKVYSCALSFCFIFPSSFLEKVQNVLVDRVSAPSGKLPKFLLKLHIFIISFRIYYIVHGRQMEQWYLQVLPIDLSMFGTQQQEGFCTNYQVIWVL